MEWSPFKCLELARKAKVEGFTSIEILNEYAEKLESQLKFSRQDADDAIADLLGFLKVVDVPGTLHGTTRDPDDDKILECALESNVDYVVSGDKDLLVLGEFRGIKIVRAAEFLQLAAPDEV